MMRRDLVFVEGLQNDYHDTDFSTIKRGTQLAG
jgi:hypothetical protein